MTLELGHHAEAKHFLDQADQADYGKTATMLASLSTAHGILALIELIQNNLIGEEEVNDYDPTESILNLQENAKRLQQERDYALERIGRLEIDNRILEIREETIRDLEAQLEGARAVARNHEITIEEQNRTINRLRDMVEIQPHSAASPTNDGKDTNG